MKSTLIIGTLCILVIGIFFSLLFFRSDIKHYVAQDHETGPFLKENQLPATTTPSKPAKPLPPTNFTDSFTQAYILEESGSLVMSAHDHWWVNSGGRMIVAQGIAQTIQGELPVSDKWYKEYSENNPRDTDNGLH